jgi:hypothetical protein
VPVSIERIKKGQRATATQSSGNPQHAVWTQPEIVGRKVVNGRVYQKDFGHHGFQQLTENGWNLLLESNILPECGRL